MFRVAISFAAAALLFHLSFTISNEIQQAYHIDKILHVFMGMSMSLFFSAYFEDDLFLILIVLVAGLGWELFQFYRDFGSFDFYLVSRDFVVNSAGDVFADFVGAVFFVWWIKPVLDNK